MAWSRRNGLTKTEYITDATLTAFNNNGNLLLVMVGWADAGQWGNPDHVYYNGLEMELVCGVEDWDVGPNQYYGCSIWEMIGAPQGSHNIEVDCGANIRRCWHAQSYGGILSRRGEDTFIDNLSTILTLNQPSLAGDLVVGIGGYQAFENAWKNWTEGANQFSLMYHGRLDGVDNRQDAEFSVSDELAVGNPTTISWTIHEQRDIVIATVAYRPVLGGVPAPRWFF